MQSLKEIILSKPCHIFAIRETLLKNNENDKYYKRVGLNRQNKEGGDIGFFINRSIIKSCTIEPNLNKTIEFTSTKLNLTSNESMIAYFMAIKNLDRQKNKQKTNLIKYQYK